MTDVPTHPAGSSHGWVSDSGDGSGVGPSQAEPSHPAGPSDDHYYGAHTNDYLTTVYYNNGDPYHYYDGTTHYVVYSASYHFDNAGDNDLD